MPEIVAATDLLEAAHVADEPTLTAFFHDTGRPPVWAAFALFCCEGSRASYIDWQGEWVLAVESRVAPPKGGWRE